MCPRQACACARVRVQVVMILRPLPSALGVWIPPSGAASARGAWKGPGLAGDSWPRWVLPILRLHTQIEHTQAHAADTKQVPAGDLLFRKLLLDSRCGWALCRAEALMASLCGFGTPGATSGLAPSVVGAHPLLAASSVQRGSSTVGEVSEVMTVRKSI